MTISAVLLALLLQSPSQPPAAPLSDEQVREIAQPEPYFRFRVVPFVVISPDAQGSIKLLGKEDGCALVASQTDQAIGAALPEYSSMVISAFRREIPEEVLRKAATEQTTINDAWYEPYRGKINTALSDSTEGIIHSTNFDAQQRVRNALIAELNRRGGVKKVLEGVSPGWPANPELCGFPEVIAMQKGSLN